LPAIDDAIQLQNAAIANGTAGPFASFDVVSEGLDLTGGNPPSIPTGGSAVIDVTRQPISPTTGTVP
jgi:hypothetical protein